MALANTKLVVFKTPDAAITSSTTRLNLHAAVDQSGRENGAKKIPRIRDAPDTAPSVQGDVPPCQLTPAPQQAPEQAPPPAVALTPRELVYGAEARRTSEGNSNKDMFIYFVL